MYRQIIIPTEKNHTISLPEHLYGKQVEVIVREMEEKKNEPALPPGLKNNEFWNDIFFDPAFPSLEEIRTRAWPSRPW